jgi:hypothetical protein
MSINANDMKKGKKRNVFYLLLLIMVASCVKNMGSIQYINDNPGNILNLSKPIVKRTEPLLVTVNNPGNNVIIRWAINPSANTSFTLVNGQDTAILASFEFAGVYRITASYFTLPDTSIAYDSSYATVLVNDSIYVSTPPVSGSDSVSIAGDQITLSPEPFANSNLGFYGHTGRLYKCESVVGAYSQSVSVGSIQFDFSNAKSIYTHFDTCGQSQSPAEIFLGVGQLPKGIYSLEMDFNQISYQGSINVTDSNYTFTWNYSSGIIISPLKVSK